MKKRYIPNILSISRILLSLLLLFLFKNPISFLLLYFLVSLTDVLDGFLARKLKTESVWGARLDSIGDFVFYIMIAIYLIAEYQSIVRPFWMPVLLILVIRLCNIVIGFAKYKRLIMIHTIANKITGLLIFLLPLALILGLKAYFVFTICATLLSSIEESAIILQSSKKSINLNQKSAFSRNS